jgi:hypothetical protein
VVIAEALLVDCCAGESNVPSFVHPFLGIFECLLCIFFDIGYDTRSAVANIGGEHHFGSKEQKEWRVAGGGVGCRALMTHKYRGCIIVLSINKSVKPNKEQKVLTSGFDQGFTLNTSKRVFRGIW